MATELQRFAQQLHSSWLPGFCLDVERNFSPEGFKDSSIALSEFDARNFLRALESGVVRDTGGGRYKSIRSYAQEQIFWEGLKAVVPRPLTLWIEPVITIGTIARLRVDYGWPAEVLGMQSKDWAFDFVVYQSFTSTLEHIAGEVKKTAVQVDNLVADLYTYGETGASSPISDHPRHVNSFKKWQSLQRSRASLLWVVGPDNYTRLMEVRYGVGMMANFRDASFDKLFNEDAYESRRCHPVSNVNPDGA